MLEIKVPGFRNGHEYKAGEQLVEGTVGYISGMDSSGYLLIKAPANSTQAALSIYPFKKYTYVETGSDSAAAIEKIDSGARINVYEDGGEYITNKIVHTAFLLSTAKQQHMWDTANVYGDTAAYSVAVSQGNTIGNVPYLYPSINTGTKGYLCATGTAGGYNDAPGNVGHFWSKNFRLVRAYSGLFGEYNHIAFKVSGRSPAYNGQYVASTGPAGAAYFLAESPYYG